MMKTATFVKTATIALWAILLTSTLACAADMVTQYNQKIEKQSMQQSLDHIMTRTMYNENIKSKTVKVSGNFLSGTVEAQSVYTSFRGDECRIIINKDLGLLGWPGESQIKRRCRIKPTKATT